PDLPRQVAGRVCSTWQGPTLGPFSLARADGRLLAAVGYSRLRKQARLPDRDLRPRPVVVVRGRAADRVDDLHPAHDPTEYRMFRVQPSVVDDVDEELAPAGVRTGIRHRDGSAHVPVLRGKLVSDRVTRPSHPRPLRVPTLDHEVRDHAVEGRSVVETLRYELSEVPRRDGHRRVEELDLHIAHRRLKEDGRHEAAIRSTYVRVHLRCVRGETEGLSR